MDNDAIRQLANNMGVQIVNLNLQIIELQVQLQKLNDHLKESEQKNTELKTQLKTLRSKPNPKDSSK